MIPKLTHTEACGLVEDALERVGRTLAYIRLRLEIGSVNELLTKSAVDRANLLCNINHYGAYMKGARFAIATLEKFGFLDIPKPKGMASTKEDRIVNKAQLMLYLESQRNLDWFLHDMPKGVEVRTEFKRDRKGKVIGATAKFVRKETKYTET